MKIIDETKMKEIQLDILKEVHEFCQKHDIDYFLCGGSLIGAVRHKGMIPWDDDIDIAMTRKNYNRFIDIYSSRKYKLHASSDKSDYLLPFAKVSYPATFLDEAGDFGEEIGINVDIFPMDGLPSERKKAEKFVKRMKCLWGLIVCATITEWSKRTFIKRVEIKTAKIIYKLFPIQKTITRITNKYAQKYDFDNSKLAGCVVWGYGLKEIVDKKSFEPTMLIPFEDFEVRIPVNYDIYLKSLYGNYMQLPLEENRIRKHGVKVYWK